MFLTGQRRYTPKSDIGVRPTFLFPPPLELDSQEELQKKRICRIITRDLPQYFAVVSRVRQDSILIGPEGGVLSSTVVPQVQAVFPEGALTKRIRVGLQVNDIALELHMRETSRLVHENMLLQRTLGWRVVA